MIICRYVEKIEKKCHYIEKIGVAFSSQFFQYSGKLPLKKVSDIFGLKWKTQWHF